MCGFIQFFNQLKTDTSKLKLTYVQTGGLFK